MDIKELRIGNAVMCQCRGEHKTHTIKSIWYNDEEKLYYVELDNGFQCNINGITPIPITEELLLKIGFKKNSFGWWRLDKRNDKFMIKGYSQISTFEYWNEVHNPEDVTEVNYGSTIELPYKINLHTFQNIWHLLTGEEMEIKL